MWSRHRRLIIYITGIGLGLTLVYAAVRWDASLIVKLAGGM